MYKLYNDIDRKFSCNVDVEGVSINECKARILIESDKQNIFFNGKISNSGLCEVNLKKLKDILPENTTGKMKLEIIAENTVFVPWESDYVVTNKKKIKVESIDEGSSDLTEEIKPKVKITLNHETNEKPIDKILIEKHTKKLKKLMVENNINNHDKFNTFN